MDDESDNPEYDLMISSKDWQKVTNTHIQAGFREGAEEGRKNAFQKGFDVGYTEGFSVGHKLGIIRGVLSVLQNDTGHSPAPSKEEEKRCKPLGNPLIDICKLCEEDNQNHDSPADVSVVRLKQERISAEKIKELKDQHAEQFTKFGIVINDIMGTK
ncbi:protein YAE1 homolog [Schistocerca piceifrons]|uniref:protein YAE1 homolog n=1 Tax=Schistocerca piceifrons TaxID=274613 RepID=UPI001F5EF60E|nr:protein YAE1 homolog [Schistocerca piceifrons]